MKDVIFEEDNTDLRYGHPFRTEKGGSFMVRLLEKYGVPEKYAPAIFIALIIATIFVSLTVITVSGKYSNRKLPPQSVIMQKMKIAPR